MAIVGPGGSGKTRLIYLMLASSNTFSPPIEKIYYFYKEYQPLFKEMNEILGIEFIPCLVFEMTITLIEQDQNPASFFARAANLYNFLYRHNVVDEPAMLAITSVKSYLFLATSLFVVLVQIVKS